MITIYWPLAWVIGSLIFAAGFCLASLFAGRKEE